MSKPCPCYGPCLAGDDRCPLIAPDPVAALLRHERDSLATQLDDAKQVIVTLRATMEQMRRERDYEIADRNAMAKLLTESRATNARLHRRAQGVDARSPDDADLIRRLRADVRGQAKHAGYVAGHVFRLQLAANFAQHATSMAVRERDEARAKLARVRETLAQRSVMAVGDVFADALRIIDEEEGGQ